MEPGEDVTAAQEVVLEEDRCGYSKCGKPLPKDPLHKPPGFCSRSHRIQSYRERPRRTTRRRRTQLQVKAIKYLQEGYPAEQASLLAGSKDKKYIQRMLEPGRNDGIRRLVLEAMEHANLSNAKLLEPIADALRAQHPKWNNKKQKWDRFPDHTVRLKASELGLNLKGAFPRPDERGPQVAVQIITNLTENGDEGAVLSDEGFVVEAHGSLVDGETAAIE